MFHRSLLRAAFVVVLLLAASLQVAPSRIALAVFSPSLIATIPVGDYPAGVGVNPTTNRIYVANFVSGSISVIDGSTNAVVTTIGTGSLPSYVGVNRTTNRIYVTHRNGSSVSVIDGSTNNLLTTIPVGTTPLGVDVNSTTNRIYVANNGSNAVSVIDGDTNTVITTITTPNVSPLYISVNPMTNRI